MPWKCRSTPPGPEPEAFAPAPPFSLANVETGSTRFTNGNRVELVAFPIPEGYDRPRRAAPQAR